MNIKSILITAGVLVVTANATELNPKFLAAIHKVESSGREGKIIGDNGAARGPFQIHIEYFKDASEYDKSLGNDYSKVNDLDFSKRVMTAYLNRYASQSIKQQNWEVLSRIHNGGPKGYKNPNTIKYWRKVQKHLK